ncbi:hypothetical protein LUZ61_001265 [Rhynchospora tenuis]|uniref:Glycosyltransferase n=1 Tax=Rhynchospora tenuis TaxID=198213 RepID=A0AAD5ZGT0_9POAL|nr:hypothetical protein LUZ61_001265 [Rhynchospora tenuis]
MGSISSERQSKPHAVCMPYPAQGHVTPMLTVAKLLHSTGFHVTFVNTEYNHRRLLRSLGPTSLDGLPDFQFMAIPDGLPFSDEDVTQDVPSICEAIMTNKSLPYFRDLLRRLNESDPVAPQVTCVFADFTMSFAIDAAKEIGIPCVLLWTASACGLLGYLNFKNLMEKGIIPLKDMNQLNDGYLDKPIDFVPGLKNMRLKDFPSFLRTTDPNDIMLKYVLYIMDRATSSSSAITINTFCELEQPVLDQIATMLPSIHEIGPLAMLSHQIKESSLKSLGSNLWKLQPGCLDWLEGKQTGSTVFVNFGSVTVMTNQQLVEFAWGLANSGYDFLWITRPDLVRGDTAVLPQEFLDQTKERGLLASWCPQDAVLQHPAIGAFLTHSGWNSTLESISGGVPMVCWPFFAEQQTNCRFACTEWEIGMEIDNNVKRADVELLIREIMGGDKGKKMKERALKWKQSVAMATQNGGPSLVNFQKLVNEVLISNK